MTTSSRRGRRMERNRKRHKQSALNLVSLMDIFTILVFFLLVSSSNVQQLPSNRDIHLPASIARKQPSENLVITVSNNYILVAGRKIIDLEEVKDSDSDIYPQLVDELNYQSTKSYFSKKEKGKGRSVTIMGDESIPYSLLRKILATCRQANYTHVAFAANQIVKEKA